MIRAAVLGIALVLAGSAPVRAQTDTLAVGDVRLVHWPATRGLAQRLMDNLRRAPRLPGLPEGLFDTGQAVHVLLAPDAERWDSLTGGRAPEWGAGIAVPAADLIILPAYASGRGQLDALPGVLRHELAHVALRRHLGVDPPRWFTEGYAVWAAGQLDTEAGWLLRVAFLMRRAPPLDSLALEWPAGATDARVAYLLSASVFQYLNEEGGERGIELLLERYRVSGHLEGSLRATYGLTFGQLERYWGRSVRRRYGWLLFAAQTTVIWLGLSAIVVALWLMKRRRNRMRLARLMEDELPDEPAFWADPPPEELESHPPPTEPPQA